MGIFGGLFMREPVSHAPPPVGSLYLYLRGGVYDSPPPPPPILFRLIILLLLLPRTLFLFSFGGAFAR